MRNWLIGGAALVLAGVVWFFLTTPADPTDRPGRLSDHEVEQTFDPFLDEESADTDEGADRADEDDPDATGETDVDTDRTDRTAEESQDPDDLLSENRATDRADPATPSDRPDNEDQSTDAPSSVDESISSSQARQLASTYLENASNDPDQNLRLYAEHVNYYDQGRVTREAVMEDKRNYLRRWPQRTYERISDVQVTDAGSANLLRFKYRYRVADDGRTAEGTGWVELGIQSTNRNLAIVSERGGVIDSD